MFQHTATRRWLPIQYLAARVAELVSTHSHPKVAAPKASASANHAEQFQHTATRRWLPRYCIRVASSVCFNTQPPEGGCLPIWLRPAQGYLFQHTATRRWLRIRRGLPCKHQGFQHTATRRWLLVPVPPYALKTMFQHTATRRWLRVGRNLLSHSSKFQHTATRRWLRLRCRCWWTWPPVSTHSHPKVAAPGVPPAIKMFKVSTHSHPKVAACWISR